MKTRKAAFIITRITVGVTALYMICYLVFAFPVRINYAFICTKTGSRHTYNDWFIFIRTDEHYSESPIETYLKTKGGAWEHRWISYAGTGKNIFGKSISWGHGSPGPILDFQPYTFDYVSRLPDTEKEKIAHVFSAGTEADVSQIVFEIHRIFLETMK